jgi:sulfate adenylyltransferase large subunit
VSTEQTNLLRFSTAGSVDDGKSTLIGRLLFDSKQVFEDQLEALQRSSDLTGGGSINLANLTDGLRAEREQGITIDVAYRYFATPKRSFIVADTPGHVQYTRNMVTGASTAHATLVLVDARQGVIEQTRRHAFLSSLLRVPHLIVCINKMDLVDYSQEIFEKNKQACLTFANKLSFREITFIPISALLGDNVVEKSTHMNWYKGPSLIEHLETLDISNEDVLKEARFSVQYIIRPSVTNTPDFQDFRGFAGYLAAGVFKVNDPVMVLPSRKVSKITQIHSYDG